VRLGADNDTTPHVYGVDVRVESNHFAAFVPFNATRDATNTPNQASDDGVPLRLDFTRGHNAGAGLYIGTQCAHAPEEMTCSLVLRLASPCTVEREREHTNTEWGLYDMGCRFVPWGRGACLTSAIMSPYSESLVRCYEDLSGEGGDFIRTCDIHNISVSYTEENDQYLGVPYSGLSTYDHVLLYDGEPMYIMVRRPSLRHLACRCVGSRLGSWVLM